MPNIEVRFLTPKEMANASSLDARYEHVKPDNLGFADPLKNRIFVRAGLDKDLTKYLLNHELEHLFELEGTDEDENGIRHKGVLDWINPLRWIQSAVNGSFNVVDGGSWVPFDNQNNSLFGSGNNATGPAAGALGGIAGGPIGAGLGMMLGDVIHNSATGKPDWAGSAEQGLETGVSQGIGKAVGGWGGNLLGQGAQTGINMAFGQGSQPSNFGEMFSNTNPSGFSSDVPITGGGFTGGFTPSGNAPGGVGTGGQSGSIGQMANNMGTGQAGITLGAQTGVPNTGTMGQGNQNSQSNPWGNFGQSMGQSPMTGNNMETGFQPMQI